MAQNTDAGENAMQADPRELMLHGVKGDPAAAMVMGWHLGLEERGDERALEAAMLINHSPMVLPQRATLTNLVLGVQAPSSEEQGRAVQRFIDRVQEYLDMEDEAWDEFLAVGSRALMRRITKPVDADLGELATEILGEPASTKLFAFDLLSHMGMEDEMGARGEELFTPRELLSQEMEMGARGAIRELLTILSAAPLGAVEEDAPIFEFITEEWEQVQRAGVSIMAHMELHGQGEMAPEEVAAKLTEMADGGTPGGGRSHEGENEQASGNSEEAEDEEGGALTEVPPGVMKYRENVEAMGDLTLRGFVVNGEYYSTEEWNHVLEQIPRGAEALLASFADSALLEDGAVQRMGENAEYLTWEKLLQVAELSRDFSPEWAMAVMEWSDEK